MKKITFKHNYHTHTTYCRHAQNTPEEMVTAAIAAGLVTLGFSEHAPLTIHRNFRLNLHSWHDYIDEINALKNKYKGKIRILCGLEAEYHRSQYKYYYQLRHTKGIDYMILGNHNVGNPNKAVEFNHHRVDLNKYGQQTKDACASGLFSCIAHPDWIYRYYPKWDQRAIELANLIIACSLKYDIPLGFNVNGLLVKHSKLDYPCDFFWKMVAKTKCQVIIETDAHCADTLSKKIVNQAIKLIHEWKLEPNLIDELIIK